MITLLPDPKAYGKLQRIAAAQRGAAPAPTLHDEIAAMFDDYDAHGGAVAYASEAQAMDAESDE